MKVLVTGANRGIGLEYCKQLVARGDKVIAVCRQPSHELSKLDLRVEKGVNVAKPALIEDLATRLEGEKIDLLINNAGILLRESLDEMSFEQIEEQFTVNALGPLRMTHALLPFLNDGAKIAMMTSRMGSIGDNTSGSRYGYRMSKVALNIASVSLAYDLKPRGISVGILHPGFVRTKMTGNNGFIEADEAVRGLLARIDELNLDNSGTFWHSNGDVLPW